MSSSRTSKECWEKVLSCWQNVEELLKDKNIQEAADKAYWAVLFGIVATNTLSKELKIPHLSVIADNVVSDLCERRPEFGGKHYTPKETIEWGRKILKQLSDEFPPNTL